MNVVSRADSEAIEDLDVAELIKRFESDIIYDCHSFVARFRRSAARRELVRRGRQALGPVVAHLRTNPPTDTFELKRAWNYLLNHIEIDADPGKSGPRSLLDTDGWIAWGGAICPESRVTA